MKNATRLLLLAVSLFATLPQSARADAYDDKARAAYEQQRQINLANAYQKSLNTINKDNSNVLKRVPRNASDVRCYDRDASFYGTMQNGCRLGNSQWNGIPVQICEDSYRPWPTGYELPPEITKCRYRLPDGRDCEMVRNPSYKPTCY